MAMARMRVRRCFKGDRSQAPGAGTWQGHDTSSKRTPHLLQHLLRGGCVLLLPKVLLLEQVAPPYFFGRVFIKKKHARRSVSRSIGRSIDVYTHPPTHKHARPPYAPVSSSVLSETPVCRFNE